MSYAKSEIDKVCKDAILADFIPGIDPIGKGTQYVECPNCGAAGKGKGLCYSKARNFAKCYSCGFSIKSPIKAVETFQGLRFPESLEYVARERNIIIITEEEKRQQEYEQRKQNFDGSFCLQQLHESGLEIDDVIVEAVDESGIVYKEPAFVVGGLDQFRNIDSSDNMIIQYFDIDGRRIEYAASKSGKRKQYVRVRWAIPEAHQTSSGESPKYYSPAGTQAQIYIPQFIRSAYKEGRQVETLIVQEGEKKAEKACKHGIPSVAIQGIFNIGSEKQGLIEGMQAIIKGCKVKNVILLFDADWDNLSSRLTPEKNIDGRPKQFAAAACKFKQYIESLHRVGLSVNVYFAHINSKEDKGIDDLLTNTLKGREDEFWPQLQDAMIDVQGGHREYVSVHKISTLSDYKIQDYWSLNDAKAFVERHKAEIEGLEFFKFSGVNYRIENGKLVQNAKSSAFEEFWELVERKGTDGAMDYKVNFIAELVIKFLEDSGVMRVHLATDKVGEWHYAIIKNGLIYLSSVADIVNFTTEFILSSCKSKLVRRAAYDKLGRWLGPDKLVHLPKREDDFEKIEKDSQKYYFQNGAVAITADSIKTGQAYDIVWADRLIERKFYRVEIFSKIEKLPDGSFGIEITQDGEDCEFLSFLRNTCDFWHVENPTTEQFREHVQHIVNKITSIGYMLYEYKSRSEAVAVVGMDGRVSEVGKSMGRTGKSLIGTAIGQILGEHKGQTVIDGKRTDSSNMKFWFSEVTERTRNLFFDDIKINFDIEQLFNVITGSLTCEIKGGRIFTIPREKAPKMYLATNHAFNKDSDSVRDRLQFMVFSDHYSVNNTPFMEFGHSLFSDWTEEQWNLFDNLMMECVMFYLRSLQFSWARDGRGCVPPPMQAVERRMQMQKMGEAFFQWAEVYFSDNNLNCRKDRQQLYSDFKTAFPSLKDGVSPSNFREKVIAFCQFKGYHFNPNIQNADGLPYSVWIKSHQGQTFIGRRDSSGGHEYFNIYSQDFADKMPF